MLLLISVFVSYMPQRISQMVSHAGQEMLTVPEQPAGWFFFCVCDIRLTIDLIMYLCHTYLVMSIDYGLWIYKNVSEFVGISIFL